MQRLTRIAIFSAFLLLFAAFLPLSAQENPSGFVSALPLFKTLTGDRIETGTLVPGPGAPPLQGSAKSSGQPVLGGLWFQIDGVAGYGPAKWTYRWMFRSFETDGKTGVYGVYIDTIGQHLQYQGNWDAATGKLEMLAKLPDGGTSRALLTLNADGSVTTDNVNSDPQGNPAVKYLATNVAAK